MEKDDLIFWCGAFGAPLEMDFANDGEAAGEWTRLCAYGDALGRDEDGVFVQRFDRDAANEIVANFNSNWNRLKRKLGIASGELPIFSGHPDHAKRAADARPQDFRVYSRVSALEARADGLYGLVRRTPELAALIRGLGPREISPRWDMAFANETDAGRRVYRPTFLKSIGLVDKGNWPEKSVINEGDEDQFEPEQKESTMQWTEEQLKRLAEIVGEDDAEKLADPEAVIARVAALKPAVPAKPEEGDAANAEAEAEKKKCEAANAALAECEAKKKEAEAANEALAARLIDFGVADGRIAAADRGKWQALFGKDAANAAECFAALKPGAAVPVGAKSVAKTAANAAAAVASADDARESRIVARAQGIRSRRPDLSFTEAYAIAAGELAAE